MVVKKKDKKKVVDSDGLEVPVYEPAMIQYSFGVDGVEGDTKKKEFDHKLLKEKKTLLLSRKKHFLIEMRHFNGSIRTFFVVPDANKFTYLGGTYLVDEDCKEFHASANCFMLRYHEGCSVPYRMDVKKDDLQGLANEIEVSINPQLIHEVVKGKYLQMLLRSAELDSYFKKAFILIIIVLVAVLAHFGASAYKLGWL